MLDQIALAVACPAAAKCPICWSATAAGLDCCWRCRRLARCPTRRISSRPGRHSTRCRSRGRRTAPQSARCRGRWPGLPAPCEPCAAEHAYLRAQLLGDEFGLGDGFVRGVHRDDRRRGQPIAEALEIIGRDDVVGADHGAPGRVVLNAGEAQPGRGVDDDKVEAELVEPMARLREVLVLTYNDAIMMIGGLFVAALFMMPLVRRPRATPVSPGH